MFLSYLTKATETSIPREKPAPVGIDLARVGLHGPPKAPLQVGAGPSKGASPMDGGLIGLHLYFSLTLSLL